MPWSLRSPSISSQSTWKKVRPHPGGVAEFSVGFQPELQSSAGSLGISDSSFLCGITPPPPNTHTFPILHLSLERRGTEWQLKVLLSALKCLSMHKSQQVQLWCLLLLMVALSNHVPNYSAGSPSSLDPVWSGRGLGGTAINVGNGQIWNISLSCPPIYWSIKLIHMRVSLMQLRNVSHIKRKGIITILNVRVLSSEDSGEGDCKYKSP